MRLFNLFMDIAMGVCVICAAFQKDLELTIALAAILIYFKE